MKFGRGASKSGWEAGWENRHKFLNVTPHHKIESRNIAGGVQIQLGGPGLGGSLPSLQSNK